MQSFVYTSFTNTINYLCCRMTAVKKYGRWQQPDMEKALRAVKEENFSVRNAAKQFCVPRAALQRHLEGKNKYAVGGKQLFGSPTVLSKQQEDDIVQHILDLEAMLLGYQNK